MSKHLVGNLKPMKVKLRKVTDKIIGHMPIGSSLRFGNNGTLSKK